MSRRSLLKRARDRAEAAVVAALVAASRIVTVGAAVRAGDALGGLLGRIDRRRRRVALANLRLAYGASLDDAGRASIVNGVYRHLGRFFAEFALLLTRPRLRPLSRFIVVEGLEQAREALREHGAAIFVTLHQGHWELLGGSFSELVTPLLAVMKPIRNPRLNARVIEMRRSFGMEVVDRDSAAPALLRALKRGRSVALLCDLNQKSGGAFVDFFGTPAATVRAPALLALRTGKPVICVTSWSTGEALRYRARALAPIVPNCAAEPVTEERRILVEINRALESFVREHPSQWNWIHPRWRTRPPPALGGDRGESRSLTDQGIGV